MEDMTNEQLDILIEYFDGEIQFAQELIKTIQLSLIRDQEIRRELFNRRHPVKYLVGKEARDFPAGTVAALEYARIKLPTT